MKTFRLILTLLLCLAVPVAGWASVMSGPLCPQLHHHHATSGGHELASTTHDAAHHHQHCGDVSTHGQPCKGDHCACGCGTGACSSSSLVLLTTQIREFTPPLGQQRQSRSSNAAIPDARGSSPLRPPIS